MRPRVILLAVLLAALALPAGWAVRDCASNPGACTPCSWDGDCAGFIYSPGMVTPEGVTVPPGQEIGYRSECTYFPGAAPQYNYCVDFDLANPDPIDASYYVATAYYAQGQRLAFVVNNAVPDLVPTCDTAVPNVWTNPTPVCWHAPTISDCAADCDPCPLDPLYIAAGSCLAEGGNTLGGTCSCCGGLIDQGGTCQKPPCGAMVPAYPVNTKGLSCANTNGFTDPAQWYCASGYCCQTKEKWDGIKCVLATSCSVVWTNSPPGPNPLGSVTNSPPWLPAAPQWGVCTNVGLKYNDPNFIDWCPITPYS